MNLKDIEVGKAYWVISWYHNEYVLAFVKSIGASMSPVSVIIIWEPEKRDKNIKSTPPGNVFPLYYRMDVISPASRREIIKNVFVRL